MPSITKSVSEIIRSACSVLGGKSGVDITPFNFDSSSDLACLSIGPVSSVNKTGDTFLSKINFNVDVRVSLAEENAEFRAMEMALAVHAALDGESFGCSAMEPTNILSSPTGEDEHYAYWSVSWEQEVYVERFII